MYSGMNWQPLDALSLSLNTSAEKPNKAAVCHTTSIWSRSVWNRDIAGLSIKETLSTTCVLTITSTQTLPYNIMPAIYCKGTYNNFNYAVKMLQIQI
jgi:hypothetical protein